MKKKFLSLILLVNMLFCMASLNCGASIIKNTEKKSLKISWLHRKKEFNNKVLIKAQDFAKELISLIKNKNFEGLYEKRGIFFEFKTTDGREYNSFRKMEKDKFDIFSDRGILDMLNDIEKTSKIELIELIEGGFIINERIWFDVDRYGSNYAYIKGIDCKKYLIII